jgi:hypothetical protein
MPLQELPIEAVVAIASLAVGLQTAGALAGASKDCLAVVRDPRTWARRTLDLTSLVLAHRQLRGLGKSLADASCVILRTQQVADALRWNREFTVAWQFQAPFDGPPAPSVGLTPYSRHAISDAMVPWDFCLEVRWRGRLLGMQLGLTSESDAARPFGTRRGRVASPGLCRAAFGWRCCLSCPARCRAGR